MPTDLAVNEFQFNGEKIDMTDMLMGVDAVVERIRDTHSIQLINTAVRSLLGMQKLSGIALSKLLWNVNNMWSDLGQDEEIYDNLYATTGLQRITIDRYIHVWNMFEVEHFPIELQRKLLQKPMKSLIVAANAVSQGYEISEDVWGAFADAHNEQEIRSIIRTEKGQAPRSNSLTIYLKRDGSLEAWTGGGEVINIGYLNIDNPDGNESLDKAIRRIVNSAGIVER